MPRNFTEVRRSFVEKGKDIARGHSLEEENRVRRIISEPSSISNEDIRRYREGKLDFAASLTISSLTIGSIPIPANSDAVWKEKERQKNLTPEEIIDEVVRDAWQKANDWKLKLGA